MFFFVHVMDFQTSRIVSMLMDTAIGSCTVLAGDAKMHSTVNSRDNGIYRQMIRRYRYVDC